MIKIDSFTFNPFSEKSYVLHDDTGACVIIDPGCFNSTEQQELAAFIEDNNLKPERLLNTHCHIDHILGNDFAAKKWNLELEAHRLDIPTLEMGERTAQMYGLPYTTSPEISKFLNEGDVIEFGNSKLEVVFVPGHCPGHVAFIGHEQRFVIGGDVLFYESVGRTDLPGGHAPTLVKSIQEKLYTLPDDYAVYNGHTPVTSIGHEKRHNPFVNERGVHPQFNA